MSDRQIEKEECCTCPPCSHGLVMGLHKYQCPARRGQEVSVCSEMIVGQAGDTFQCVLAEHGGQQAHDFGVEHRVYGRLLTKHHDAEWLAAEVRALHVTIASLQRDRANDDTARRFNRLMGRLAQIAPANASRKTIPVAHVRAAYEEARG